MLAESDWKIRNCWTKLFFLFSLCTKKYSCSFVKLYLNIWCHMDYFNDVLTTFLGLERGSSIAVYAGSKKLSDFIKKISVLQNWRSYGSGTTWGWVINDRILIFGWTIPLNILPWHRWCSFRWSEFISGLCHFPMLFSLSHHLSTTVLIQLIPNTKNKVRPQYSVCYKIS